MKEHLTECKFTDTENVICIRPMAGWKTKNS